MKKLITLINIIVCILLCACSPTSLDTNSEKNAGNNSDASPVSPPAFISFDTLAELQNALSSKNEDELYSFFLRYGTGNKQIEAVRSMVKTIRSHNNIVPYLNENAIELRNEEGFNNITMFASEKYGLPCIFYHPKVSNGDNLYITVTCIPDELLQNHKSSTASELIKIMAPGYPNVDDVGNYCSAVYNTTIKLHDREVAAMVYEYKDDNRNGTFFVYDNLLVEVRNDPNIWTEKWFSTLSFGGFEQFDE